MTQASKTPGRNAPCPCGSGRKYKQCCLEKDEAALRKAKEEAAEAGQEASEPAAADTDTATENPSVPRRHGKESTGKPWKRGAPAHPSQRTMPRKAGNK